MSTTTRWGILGPGNIAKKFAAGLQALPDAELAAVGSRTAERAVAFAEEFGGARAHGSYEELAADPEVDAIYVATPHPFHAEHSILCLEAGKPVLCEKPFTVNAEQARVAVETARRCDVFLMEAMWTRFLPVMDQVRAWLQEGAIGEVLMVSADFGFRAGVNPEGRLFNPALGGGALLDVGIYPLSFASMVLGADPVEIRGTAHIGSTGVDEISAMTLRYAGGQVATLSTAVRANTPKEARIVGSEGTIYVDAPFFVSEGATLIAGQREERFEESMAGNGYNYQAAAVAEALARGEREHPVMPLNESLALMGVMDELRAQWGLKYPME